MENANVSNNNSNKVQCDRNKDQVEVSNFKTERPTVIKTWTGVYHGCDNKPAKPLHYASNVILCQKFLKFHHEVIENEYALKQTNSNKTLETTRERCNKCNTNANSNNSSNKTNKDQIGGGEAGAAMLGQPPAYSLPAVDIVDNYEDQDNRSYCVVHRGAAILIGVLVAIIACLVIALTLFLVSDKVPGDIFNTRSGLFGSGNTEEPKIEATINQTGQCGFIPEKYQLDYTERRSFQTPSNEIIHNNGTERIIGGVPANIKQYPWQISASSPKPVLGRSYIQPRVMGGLDTSARKIPWQVSLWVRGKGQSCGGAILTKDWIITAAHCTASNTDVSAWAAYFGETNMGKKANGEKRKIVKIIQHPKYTNDDSFDYDLSLMKLDSSLPFTDKIQPICLPLQGSMFKNNTQCYVSGWGATDNTGSAILPLMLQHAQIDLFDRETCLNWLGSYVTERMICAGKETGESDACQGDSGGPLSCYSIDSDTWILVGVVSWGIECGLEQLPGVYTNIAVFTDWIWKAIVERDNQ